MIDFTGVLPTLVELCELEKREAPPFDGESFAGILRGNAPGPEKIRFWQWNRREPLYGHNAAIRENNWKLVRPFVTKNLPEGESTLPPLLFDLAEDPSEETDLSTVHPRRVERMNAALETWARSVEESRIRP